MTPLLVIPALMLLPIVLITVVMVISGVIDWAFRARRAFSRREPSVWEKAMGTLRASEIPLTRDTTASVALVLASSQAVCSARDVDPDVSLTVLENGRVDVALSLGPHQLAFVVEEFHYHWDCLSPTGETTYVTGWESLNIDNRVNWWLDSIDG